MKTSTGHSTYRTNALSKDEIIAVAIKILDAANSDALTFRALAGRLSTGTGALYHYVVSKDELLSEATNLVISQALQAVPVSDKPLEDIRAIALSLFEAFEDHPWVGFELARENRRDGLVFAKLSEAIGTKLMAMGVPPEAQFNVASALGSYIVGAASQNAANAHFGTILAAQGVNRTTYLTQLAARWRENLDPSAYPFVYRFLDKLPDHDDREQFLAGIDLLLAGISASYK